MYKVEFDIHHKGCWGSEISRIFPSVKFSSIDCRWINKNVAHILVADLIKAIGNESLFQRIENYLKRIKNIAKVEVVSKEQNKILIRTLTKHTRKHQQFSDIFFNNNLFLIAPIRFEDNYEKWRLATTDKKNITQVYNLLKKKYPTRIVYLKEENLIQDLTYKQREILNYAQYFGYYEWPRKKSATEIAGLIQIPKTVFLSHLRKAEKKIIHQYFNQVSGP